MGQSLTQKERLVAKRRAVALRAEGKTHVEIAELTGLSRPTVADALRRHAAGGDEALEPKRPGRKPGTGRWLSAEREREVQQIVRDCLPRDFGLAEKRWNRKAVQALTERLFRFAQIGLQPKMKVRTAGHYLARWSMTGVAERALAARVSEDSPETAAHGASMALWELLGWYPGKTGRLAALADQLSRAAWTGQRLFAGLRQPWSIRRGCIELQSLDLDRRLQSVVDDAEIAALRTDGVPFTYRDRKAMVARLWASNTRTDLLREVLAVDTRLQAKHWSVRIFYVQLVDVRHGRTISHRPGRSDGTHRLRRALFVGQLELRSGATTATLLTARGEGEDAEDALIPKVLRTLRPIIASGKAPADVYVHLPVGYLDDYVYAQVARWADGHRLHVREDMLPVCFLTGAPAVVHYQLAKRAGGPLKALTQTTTQPSWEAARTRMPARKPSGPIPGEIEDSIACVNRKLKRREGKKDKT